MKERGRRGCRRDRGISRAESERFASRLGIDDDAGNECFRGGEEIVNKLRGR